jgi:hypothetical protein
MALMASAFEYRGVALVARSWVEGNWFDAIVECPLQIECGNFSPHIAAN